MILNQFQKGYLDIVQNKKDYVGKLFTRIQISEGNAMILDLKNVRYGGENCGLVIVYLTKDKVGELELFMSRFNECFKEIE